ncbi:hypothetical protein [Cohnella herbarum]|uniref:Lipoprotein n=1 Tax=Cohnella herbarum TaxID=2728023 RepID=A0A7Z2VL81_9BACL|nr:hypothetical protein [Cohnella herbarum]QJD85112.1 hypothetical protein HH215_19345 [Cohnella herbarum]
MKKYVVIGLLLIGLLALAGCTAGKSITFKGAGESWSVVCKVNPSAKTKSYEIKHIAKGEKVSNVSYAFTESQNFDQQSQTESEAENMKITGSATIVDPIAEETSFKLTMKWNGKEETIIVKREK